ncbi:MAG: hypothetical protein GYA46_08155 [candidate division Zixibacteria bacterium]|nr:hypothetical protein [candidate division Zixibacteria bacterium]
MDWGTINYLIEKASAILGLALMIFGLIGGIRSFYIWLTRPKIDLFFNESRTFDRRKNWTNNQPCGSGIWVHVFARGKCRIRKEVITGCQAYLRKAWSVGPGDVRGQIPDFNAKLQLQWANSEGRLQTEIFPSEEARIDLFMIPDGPSALYVVSGTGLPTGSTKRFEQGVYIFEIACTANNAKRGEILLKVAYGGGFVQPKITVL